MLLSWLLILWPAVLTLGVIIYALEFKWKDILAFIALILSLLVIAYAAAESINYGISLQSTDQNG